MKSLVILLSLPFIKNKKSKTTFKSSLNSHVYWHTMYTKYRVRPVYCIHCTHFYIRIQGHNKLETLENGKEFIPPIFYIYDSLQFKTCLFLCRIIKNAIQQNYMPGKRLNLTLEFQEFQVVFTVSSFVGNPVLCTHFFMRIADTGIPEYRNTDQG